MAKRKRQAKKAFNAWFRQEMRAMDREALKSYAQLLAEFDNGTLSEDGLIVLIERGYRDELLARTASTDDHLAIWHEFLLQEEARKIIEQDRVVSFEELDRRLESVRSEAARLAHS